jgi:hypothetical protein
MDAEAWTKRSASTAIGIALRRQWVLVCGMAALFVLASPAKPLFFQNQSTKFIAGMADANVGFLRYDWFANTRNGLPVYRGLVYLMYALHLPQLSYVLWGFLTAAFLVGALAVSNVLRGVKDFRESLTIDQVGLIFLSVLVLSRGLVVLSGDDLLDRVWSGVALQSMFYPALEPALFSTLFIVSIALYATGRRVACMLIVLFVTLVHPGFIIPALALLGGLWIGSYTQLRDFKLSDWLTLALALALMALHATYLKIHFAPTSPELARRAETIVTHEAIPFHTLVSSWLPQFWTLVRVTIVLLAIWFSRKHLIGRTLLVALAAVVVLTVAQVWSGDPMFAWIAPWRISVWLVPVSLIVLFTELSGRLAQAFDLRGLGARAQTPAVIFLGIMLTATAIGGLVAKARDFDMPARARYEDFLMRTANSHTLILAPTDLKYIRVDTLAPAYITRRAHPYLDVDVLEWHRRVQLVDGLYKPQMIDCTALESLAREAHITLMVVTRFDQVVSCPFATIVYMDAEAKIYALKQL